MRETFANYISDKGLNPESIRNYNSKTNKHKVQFKNGQRT